MAAGPHAAILPWDSEFFATTVARVDAPDPAALAAGDQWCREHAVTVAYLSVDADAPTELFAAAADAGFRVVDIRITFGIDGGQLGPMDTPRTDAVIRDHEPADLPALERIASSAHHDSRFYADLRFARERCDALYAAWIRRDCADPARRVLVAERHGTAVGYFTYALDGPIATVGLVGVDEAHRGAGVGQALVATGLRAASRDADHVTVATQGRNVGAQRLYQRAGMTTEHVGVWWHKWYDGAR